MHRVAAILATLVAASVLLVAWQVSPLATVSPTSAPTAAPTPVPTPTAEPTSSGVYGSAIAMDSKNNYPVGWTINQDVAHRFRAGTTSALTSIAINQRGGPGYSGGNGGVLKVAIQTDAGGRPSGTTLAALTFSPGNASGNWEVQRAYSFASPPTLTKGQLYHVVFTNVGASPTANYISINEVFTYNSTIPRQPAFSDDFAVLSDRGSGWVVSTNDTPVMDLTYANGHHDGNAYYEVVVDYHTLISGTTAMARERFTVTGGDRAVSSAAVRVKRISGSSPLTLRLESSTGAILASGTTSASQIPLTSVPVGNDALSGGRWVTVNFPTAVVLSSGSTYHLRMSTSADTTYVAVPIRQQEATAPTWGSRAFRDGSAQRTTDGSTWREVYRDASLDFQFYVEGDR